VFVGPPTLVPTHAVGLPATVSHDLDAELPEVDAVMMLRVQAERMYGRFLPSEREYAATYGLDQRRLQLLPEHAAVMHPGPMVRGMEITPAVADARASVVTEQVRNGVHLRMAVLYHLLAGGEDD